MLSDGLYRYSFDPARFFVWCAGLIGLVLLFLTPPFQVPDESHHFFRAYQVSLGQFVPVSLAEGLGGNLPSSLVNAVQRIEHAGMAFNPMNKIDVERLFELFERSVARDVYEPVIFTNTAFYSPVPYLPQAIGIRLAETLWSNPLSCLYGGRLANLVMYLMAMYWAIKVTPIQKNMLAVLGLMPMAMFLAPSLSSDVFTIGVSMLFLAFILSAALDRKALNIGRRTTIILLAFCLGQCKLGVYLPLVGVVLLIRPSMVGGAKKFAGFLSLVVIFGFVPALLWLSNLKLIGDSLVTLKQPVGDPLSFILSHPASYMWFILNTFHVQFSEICRMFVGVLGWLDTILPKFVTMAYLLAILVFSLDISSETSYRVGGFRRLIGLCCAVASVLAICTALFINWPQQSYDVLTGLQGRYFIPLAPYVLLTFYYGKRHAILRNLNLTLPLIICATWIVTFATLYFRYWTGAPTPQILKWMGVRSFS